MQALEFLALVLVNLALTIYLVEKGYKFWKEKRRLKRLVNQHPEMQGCGRGQHAPTGSHKKREGSLVPPLVRRSFPLF